jgi:prevent-host-death family protein
MNRTKTVGAYEAKTTLSALLTLVEGGGEVIITKHERPVARLVPFDRRSPKADVNGVLANQGGRFGGWGLFVQDGKPEFVHAFSNQP